MYIAMPNWYLNGKKSGKHGEQPVSNAQNWLRTRMGARFSKTYRLIRMDKNL
jgi:hypothetical protein